jgi:asparagine synthase (glutamine-hydrolysing)
MCGILGLYTPNSRPDLSDKLALLRHRGPDDAGSYTGDGIYLGARRLSIIDVAGGHQPLAAEGGRIWVVQNGEIYNYLALRAELEELGQVFRTRSDTEVIGCAYAAWGDACVEHLRGIFAFAVWDAPRRKLLLARDRFGIKPLYYARLPGGLAFASEVRPLLMLLPTAPRADLAALRAMFALGYVPSPHTAFEVVHELPAASCLVMADGQERLDRYWDLPAPPANGHARLVTEEEAAHGLRQHLERAVNEQRMSEVPLGALLSGGLDSTSVAALLQAAAPEPLHTFNIGFEAEGYDETRFAALAAQHLGTRHHQLYCRASDFERYPEVVRRLEEPQCSATALPIYLLYEACRQAGLTVILTGEGADELLGGYHWFQGEGRVRRLLGLPAAVRHWVAAGPVRMSPAAQRVLRSGERGTLARYGLWQQAGGPEVNTLLSPALRAAQPALGPAHYFTRQATAGAEGWDDPFRQFQYYETHTRLVDFINFEVDRMSMAHSIEARVPFLDHELWEYAARLPSRLFTHGAFTKRLLRKAMRGLVPGEVLDRPKQGLAAPYAAWLRAERWPDWAEAGLEPRALGRSGYFDATAVGRLRAEHTTGRADHSRLLMGVLSTQCWHSQFLT